ncbi:MAG: N-acetylmuramoyl-L-alanine amidase [Novosphingobium sp.]|jgi:N-acetylmuramoyl-L-alanine amidase|nr:N-acetylmuramoyl-L-alanine amidase [Novosphingobium sp.]
MPHPFQFALFVAVPLALAGALVGAARVSAVSGGYAYIQRIALPPASGRIGLPEVRGPLGAGRPLVVLDAGHGGHDPGAGKEPLAEKTLTLQLAQALRDELLKGGGIRVAMTRDDDRFLLLPERSGIARRLNADLFLSIHADSVENNEGAHGASVYTLSERGGNEAAALLAARENRADTINGISLAGTSDAVSAILVDLSQREAQAKSEEFARLILREATGRMPLHDQHVQSAAFVVLKSPDMPSVLFESGYVSNPGEAAKLASPEGRATFAQATARAIRLYFARQSHP